MYNLKNLFVVLSLAILCCVSTNVFAQNAAQGCANIEIQELIGDIKLFLGCHRINKAVLVGVGSLGTALLGYKGFKDYGLEIIKAFDKNESIIGNKIKGLPTSK